MSNDQLMELYEKYAKYLGMFQDENLDNMLNTIGSRLLTSSYTLRTDEPYCGPGGIIKFALDSFSFANKMSKGLDNEVAGLSKKSLALITLLFPIGRMGDLEHNLFIEQKSEWHRDKLGQLYDWNEKCPKMSVQHRTLYFLQHFGVKLTYEEMIGILCAGGMHLEDNKFYLHSLPQVSHLCIYAIDLAYENEKLKNKKRLGMI